MMGDGFQLGASLSVARAEVGQEREPVLLIDGIAETPEALVDFAANEVFAPAYGPKGGYPGLRAPAPLAYVERLARSLSPTIEAMFGLRAVKLARAECSFSLVTLSADALAPSQRVPHVDTVDPLQFAFLHYLCDESFGGTAFYRHRATGFETLSADRLSTYEASRASEGDPAPGYINGDSPHFVQTGAIEARFNRLVIYRSRLLHSGRIAPATPLSPNPRRGRLTANLFVNYRPL